MVSDLPLDRKIEVRLTSDGFEAWRTESTIPSQDRSGQVQATLKQGPVEVELAVSPATVRPMILVDGKEHEGLVVSGLSPHAQHTIVVRAVGYAEQTINVTGDPFEKKRVDLTLEPANVTRAEPRLLAKPVAPIPSTTVQVLGKLNVSASGGWCNVVVDGVPKGPTPVAGVEVPVGSHRVTCAVEGGATKSESVVVREGATTRHRFVLGD